MRISVAALFLASWLAPRLRTGRRRYGSGASDKVAFANRLSLPALAGRIICKLELALLLTVL
jgi:hypothetical protein